MSKLVHFRSHNKYEKQKERERQKIEKKEKLLEKERLKLEKMKHKLETVEILSEAKEEVSYIPERFSPCFVFLVRRKTLFGANLPCPRMELEILFPAFSS